MSSARELSKLQSKIWAGSVPLEIRLASSECRTYDVSDAYYVQCPRLSYLPFLLERLQAFFASSLIEPEVAPHQGWFSCEGVPLKWHYPLGLLYDLYSGAEPAHPGNEQAVQHSTIHGFRAQQQSEEGDDEAQLPPIPWKLTVHFTSFPTAHLIPLDAEMKSLHDSYINNVKEADFLRNGTAKTVMSLSEADSRQLWRSVETQDLASFIQINNKLLNPTGGAPLRHIPIRVYLPSTATGHPILREASPAQNPNPDAEGVAASSASPAPGQGSLKVVQAPITPTLPGSRQLQTLGTALNCLLPTLFVSRRSPVLAQPVLHGAAVPLNAGLEDLMKAAAYADGWLHVGVVML